MLQSQIIKNGQQLNVMAGVKQVVRNDLMIVGGPGNQAYTIATADYASQAGAVGIASNIQVNASAVPYAGTRAAVARDRTGAIYMAGTNSSGNLVIYKHDANGIPLASAVVDATATSVNAPYLFQLQSGGFACVYARATGLLYFVIFDAGLSLIAGPIAVATERATANVVYHSACALSGGGFAIVYQTSAGTAINLATYSNTGAAVLAATGIQVLAATAAQVFIRMGQLSSGNLVVAFDGTMTAGGIAGTSVVIVTPAGGAVAGPISLDSVANLGLVELSIMSGFFAVATTNATNLIAAVFNNAGVQQGSTYTVGNTLSAITHPQFKIVNDAVSQFWLVWLSSVNNGINVIGITSGGATGTAATAIAPTIIAASSSIDAALINNIIAVFTASTTNGGQFLTTIALPNASLGYLAPSLRLGPVVIGAVAATTGARGPRCIGGGDGMYVGTSPPAGQPVNVPPTNGDFTAILLWDQLNVATTRLGVQKFEASAVVGIGLTAVANGAPGTIMTINPGPGEYITNPVGGSSGTPFNHLISTPAGTSGVIYQSGVGLAGLTSPLVGTGTFTPAMLMAFAGSSVPSGWALCGGQALSRSVFASLFAQIGTTYGSGDGSSTFNVIDLRGRVPAGLDDMNGIAAGRLTATTMTPNGTTLGASGGNQTNSAGVTVNSISVSVSGGISGSTFGSITANVSGTTGNASNLTGADGGGNTSAPDHTHNFSGSGSTSGGLGVTGTFSGSGSGTGSGFTATFSVCQPTVLVNWLIKL